MVGKPPLIRFSAFDYRDPPAELGVMARGLDGVGTVKIHRVFRCRAGWQFALERSGDQLPDQAWRAFDPGAGKDAEAVREREIEKLHAKIGQLTVERDFLAKASGR